MKNLICIMLLSLFAFVACQTDEVSTEVEIVNIDNTELKRALNNTSALELISSIQEKFKDNPEAYLQSLPKTTEDNTTYGCVTFLEGGIAVVTPGCTITNGVPPAFSGCTVTKTTYLACGWEPFINCVVCAVEYTIVCDGREFTFIGNTKTCPNDDPQPL